MANKAAATALLMIFCACVIMGAAGCGKKGPPQPPDERFYILDGR